MKLRRFFTLFASLSTCLMAQDGGQLYTLYCSACHGADGKGATGGAFPPLASSEWIKGDAKRPINIVLHGMEGPIDVAGKTYNLAMPPQGALLPDDQIAAILTFVRSSWGNTESAVNVDEVKAVRAATADRKKPWTAPELTKEFPLALEKTALSDLISMVYKDASAPLGDLSTLTATSVEEEHSGIIDVAQAAIEDKFAIMWTGKFNAPAKGSYTFLLDADDSARLTINGKVISEVKGLGPINSNRKQISKIDLEQGPAPIKIEYIENIGNQGIELAWKGPESEKWNWLSKEKSSLSPVFPEILIEPKTNNTAIYRNFIAGTTPRAIGFGFPGGVNLAYSADNLATELIWKGKFMNGGRHWTDRGQGSEPPAGTDVIKISSIPVLPKGARFLGYKLDEAGNPTFYTTIGDAKLSDSWKPSSDSLVRQISLNGGSTAMDILVSNLATEISSSGDILFEDKAYIQIQGTNAFKKENKIMINMAPGKSATLTYRWK